MRSLWLLILLLLALPMVNATYCNSDYTRYVNFTPNCNNFGQCTDNTTTIIQFTDTTELGYMKAGGADVKYYVMCGTACTERSHAIINMSSTNITLSINATNAAGCVHSLHYGTGAVYTNTNNIYSTMMDYDDFGSFNNTFWNGTAYSCTNTSTLSYCFIDGAAVNTSIWRKNLLSGNFTMWVWLVSGGASLVYDIGQDYGNAQYYNTYSMDITSSTIRARTNADVATVGLTSSNLLSVYRYWWNGTVMNVSRQQITTYETLNSNSWTHLLQNTSFNQYSFAPVITARRSALTGINIYKYILTPGIAYDNVTFGTAGGTSPGRLLIYAYNASNATAINITGTINAASNSTTIAYTHMVNVSLLDYPKGVVTATLVNNTFYTSTFAFYNDFVTSQTVYAYMIPQNSPYVSLTNFLVYNSLNIPVANASIVISQFVNGSVYNTTSKYTDSSGNAAFYLDSTVSYTVRVTASGYQTYTTTINPTLGQYIITLASSSGGGVIQTNIGGAYWKFSPTARVPNTGQLTLNFSISFPNATGSWFAWKVYNHSTLIDQQNDSVNISGGSFRYIDNVMNNETNLTVRVWFVQTGKGQVNLTYNISTYTPYGSNPSFAGALSGASAIGSWTVMFAILIVSVMVAGWVAQYSSTGAVVSFLAVIILGSLTTVGIWAVTGVVMIIVIVAVAYWYITNNKGV